MATASSFSFSSCSLVSAPLDHRLANPGIIKCFNLHLRNQTHFLVAGQVNGGTICLITTYPRAVALRKDRKQDSKGVQGGNKGNSSMNEDVRIMCQRGQLKEALSVLHLMNQGIKVDSNTYAQLLQVCAHVKSLDNGRIVHAHMVESGFEPDTFLGSNLVNMYMKCGSVFDALQVFDKMPHRNVVTWTTMVTGYSQNGHGAEALRLFSQMQWEGAKPNQFTFGSILSACASLAALEHGMQVHAYIIKDGFESDACVTSALIDMYAKCDSIDDARHVFDKMGKRDLFSWTAMIAGYSQNGLGKEALQMFSQMQWEGIKPNHYTFGSVLRACASQGSLEQTGRVHAHIIKSGFEVDVCVGSALAGFYGKCGRMKDAVNVFDKISQRNLVSWTALITGYSHNGNEEAALKLFCQMQEAGIKPNQFTFASILGACAGLSALEQGKQVHGQAVKLGFESDVLVGNALITVYAKCRSNQDVCKLFVKMPERDAVSWSAMIAGYSQNGRDEESLKCFCQMQQAGIVPNQFAFASAIGACASMGALEQSKQFHGCIIKSVSEPDVCVMSALVTMYAKCGSIEDAFKVFENITERDVVSWNAMISAYAQHGLSKQAFQLFEQMQQSGTKPNHITLIGILSACSHAGLVDEGHHYFDSMSRDYGITPTVEHYACMVDLLGRAGLLNEAKEFISKMPFEPDAFIWRTLLGACKTYGNTELGKYAAECILKLEPQDAATYVLLSNLYAASGRWDDREKVRNMMEESGVKKESGHSWIEVKNRVHTFIAADKSHPLAEKIYEKLDQLARQMKAAGYVPDMNFVLHDV